MGDYFFFCSTNIERLTAYDSLIHFCSTTYIERLTAYGYIVRLMANFHHFPPIK